MDHNFPFRACSAHYCLGQVVDVIVDILQAVNILQCPNGEMICFLLTSQSAPPLTSTSTTSSSSKTPLSIPWHASKWNDFSSMPTYLGLVLDFENRTVALAEHKHEKYLAKLTEFLCLNSSSRILKKDALHLLRTLSHVTIVHQDGRNYLSALSSFISSFTSDHKPR